MRDEPTCEACGRPFSDRVGCPASVVREWGWAPSVYVYGTEPEIGDHGETCRSCGVDRLESHHVGCTVAVCRVCEWQAFGCECCDGGDDDEDEAAP